VIVNGFGSGITKSFGTSTFGVVVVNDCVVLGRRLDKLSKKFAWRTVDDDGDDAVEGLVRVVVCTLFFGKEKDSEYDTKELTSNKILMEMIEECIIVITDYLR
jgi:hypothetical protein